jgi:hypothetical protein
MKPKLSREVALLSLPVLLLAGVAWWKGAGGQEKTSSWWERVNRSQIKVVKSFAWTMPPYDMAERAGDNDTTIAIWTEQRVPVWLRGEKYVPKMGNLKHSGGPLPNLGKAGGSQIMTGSITYGTAQNMSGEIDLDGFSPPPQFWMSLSTLRAARRIGEVRVTGNFVAQNLPPLPFSLVARPAWMVRPSKKLRVLDAKWRKARGGSGGDVAITLLYLGSKPFDVRGANGQSWKPRYKGFSPAQLKGDTRRDEIIAHWSQHIESGDGKYHSLRELENQEVDLLTGAKVGQELDTQGLADKFEPRVLPLSRTIFGKKLRVVFDVTSLPKSIRNPVFKAELGVVGDGFVQVSLPLK